MIVLTWLALLILVLLVAVSAAGLSLALITYHRQTNHEQQRGRRGKTGATGNTGATSSDSLNDIQQQVKTNNYQSFLINNLYNQVLAGTPPPSIPNGRTILFQNQTNETTLDIYVTQGYPSAVAASLVTGGQGVLPGSSVSWSIPPIQGWSGNFAAYPSGNPPLAGSTLAEFGFNQLWSGFTPPLRDTFDISTVPPGIGTLCNNGPHGPPPANNNCEFFSRQSGFSTQQSFGYNVGIQIIPPSTGSLPSQTVTCIQSDGNSPESVGFPNDTAFPKQQTIECLPAPAGNFTVNFLDPVVSLP